MKTLVSNPSLEGMYEIHHDVTYVMRDDKPLTMDIIGPWPGALDLEKGRLFPTVLFIQGSAWTCPNIYFQLPQLCELARRGYVVATMKHRSSYAPAPFPAFVEDVKSALRYLRVCGSHYGVDPDRIGLWGTSSGANGALIAVFTAGTDLYVTEDNVSVSDAVACVVDCFGPVDIDQYVDLPFNPYPKDLDEVLGGHETEKGHERARAMSPLYLVEAGHTYPPMQILHGTADTMVPFSQSQRFYEKLIEQGYDAELVAVEGADHERDFWSQAVLDEIYAFLDRHLHPER